MAEPTAIMPTLDWLAICDAITEEIGEEFRMTSKDIPKLIDYIAIQAMERHIAKREGSNSGN